MHPSEVAYRKKIRRRMRRLLNRRMDIFLKKHRDGIYKNSDKERLRGINKKIDWCDRQLLGPTYGLSPELMKRTQRWVSLAERLNQKVQDLSRKMKKARSKARRKLGK